MDTEEVVKPAAQSAAAVEWRLSDRFVIRYEFASRQWSGQVQSYEDATGELGEPRDLASGRAPPIARQVPQKPHDARRTAPLPQSLRSHERCHGASLSHWRAIRHSDRDELPCRRVEDRDYHGDSPDHASRVSRAQVHGCKFPT
jgi:hypothetical protein